MTCARDDRLLFNDGDLDSVLRQIGDSLEQEISTYDANKLLNTPVADLCQYFVAKFTVDPVELLESEITTDQRESALSTRRIPDADFLFAEPGRSVPATSFSFFIPFSGDSRIFQCRPNSFTLNPPRGAVHDQELVLTFIVTGGDGAGAKRDFDAELFKIKQYLGTARGQVNAHNYSLTGRAQAALDARRGRLLQAQNSAAALGFPMRRRPDSATTYAAPTVRRKLRPSPPPAGSTPFAPEPALPSEEYEHVLSVMENMAVVLERSPSAFRTMGEEAIRNHFLVQLNGHYEGQATGETFNVEGKTDILIRDKNRNIFIAECKFWDGPVAFTRTVDQLLGYVSWRDTKTAIVLFNRNAGLSEVLAKIPDALRSHAAFKRLEPSKGETRFRAVLRQKNDPGRELTLTVLVFDVPRESKKGSGA